MLCDFRKAYDTIDREFLYAVLDTLGAGAGFLGWVKLLLTDTRASAMVNGCLSNPEQFRAGVRQGCPLAPLLYLFVALALLHLLKAKGVGIQAAGLHLSVSQYADDASAFLEGGSLDEVTFRVKAFLEAMRTFAAATGQHLNRKKTQLFPIGAPPFSLPSSIESIDIVHNAKVLGITLNSGSRPPAADWPQLLKIVESCFSKLAHLGLSAFGRAFSSTAYGTSKFLFQAEFTGFPTSHIIETLDTWTAKLVDSSRPPSSSNRRFAGLKKTLLAAPPRSGGFGSLPWKQHIYARHAVWALRLITDGLQDDQESESCHQLPVAASATPWIAVAHQIMRYISPEFRPAHLLLLDPSHPLAVCLPIPLKRMHLGLRALPRASLLAEPPPPGPWCSEISIWENLMLWPESGHRLADIFPLVYMAMPQARILEILVAHHEAQSTCPPFSPWRQQLATLMENIPFAVQQAAWEHAAAPSGGEQWWLDLLSKFGWKMGDKTVLLQNLKVSQGTHLQLIQPGTTEQPSPHEQRQEKLATFAALAEADPILGDIQQMQNTSSSSPLAVKVTCIFNRVWKLKWDNTHKEVFWRLALNALPLASRMKNGAPKPCACGCAEPDRRHHFWECPIAIAVRSTIAQQIPDQRLSIFNLWLFSAPSGIQAGIWDVVCLAAIVAMDSGRRRMTKVTLESKNQNSRLPLDIVSKAGKQAVTRFWDLLQDFCAVGAAPCTWESQVGPNHPFFTWRPATKTWQVDPPVSVV